MKKMIFLLFSVFCMEVAMAQSASTETLQNAQFKVLGNCGMCKKTIEKAALSAGAATANWDEKTDLIALAFNDKKTSKEAIQKAIALAGYDNAEYKASDAAYSKLPGCCQYDRTGEAGGTKSCTMEAPKNR